MKIAYVHDWLVDLAGAEKVLAACMELYDAPIFTLLKHPKKLKNTPFEKKKIHGSFIEKLPFARSKYRNYLPFFPMAIEQMDLGSFDLVISSSHCVAKGVIIHPHQLHICYCHTPMRYLWDCYHEYLEHHGLKRGIKAFFAKYWMHKLRMWDVLASKRVDLFIANSTFIQKRIQKVYRRDSIVLHPPVDCKKFEFSEEKQDFYVTASRLVPYKRIDILVEAFNLMPEKKLVVIGDGPNFKKLKKMAQKNITFLGHVPFDVLKEHFKFAKAFLFAAFEDFGIVPVEAMSAGTPVIAFGKGGILDSVIDGKTGLFFKEQTKESVKQAVMDFETRNFDSKVIRKHALKFDKAVFQEKFQLLIETKKREFFQ